MTLFDGTTDPCDHISQFKQKMMVTTATGASKEAFLQQPQNTQAAKRLQTGSFGDRESIKDYVTRFNAEKVSIRGCDMSTAINAFRQGLDKESNLYKELTMYPCERFEEVQQRATAALRLEEDIQARKGTAGFDRTSRKSAPEKRDDRIKPYSRPNISRVAEKAQQIDDSPHPPKLSEYGFNTGMEGLLKALRNLGDQVRWPKPPTQDRPNDDRDSSKRCEWHQDIGHRTEDCYKLRREVKFQVRKGNLDHLLSRGGKQDRREAANQWRSNKDDDALTITLSIGNCTVRKALVDTGSSVNLIMLETLKTMGFDKENLVKKSVPLVGFSGEIAFKRGEITIPTYIEGVNKLVRYLIIEGPTTYNVILGRPWLHQMKAVPSTYHQCLKFPTPWGTRFTVKGDQEESSKLLYPSPQSYNQAPLIAIYGDRGTSAEYKEPPRRSWTKYTGRGAPDRTVLIGATCGEESWLGDSISQKKHGLLRLVPQ
ncbi:uncharacterized protein LOC141594595 [Silene latifolia]|uniref:uncharacterized protein LOC141594595 n=1 Tax=Silene latifolia TaxID=37657 RepID=UPI003D7840D8